MQGKKLKSAIKESGLTQAELAVRLGMSRQTLSNYLRVEKVPSGILDALKN